MIQKIRNLKFVIRNCNKGMTYVELIVVLSIFSVLSSVTIYNYRDFQSMVDMRNLSSDIALQVVKAQKDSLAGLLPSGGSADGWKPSYGVQFDLSKGETKSFIYFVDSDNSGTFNGTDCTDECLNKVSIAKGNFISSIDVYNKGKDPIVQRVDNLTITFARPSSGAIIKDSGSLIDPALVNYAEITASSPGSVTSSVKIYVSGRIQID